MSGNLVAVISKALSEGYQLDPAAFELLSKLPSDIDPDYVMRDAIQRKVGRYNNRVITKEDIEEVVPKELLSEDVAMAPEPVATSGEIEVVDDPTGQIAPVEAELGFKKLFQDRYWRLVGIAKKRPDSKNLSQLDSVKGMRTGKVRIAGLLSARNSRHGGVELVLDDPTGSARVQCGDELSGLSMHIPLDSLVIAEVSGGRGGQLYANSLTLPDVPSHKPIGASHRAYAILLSDLHIGSKMFLGEDFQRLLDWLNGKSGERDVVSRIKYIIIAGDIIDGIGVYPGQEYQLAERNLTKQYIMAAGLIEKIPKHIKILVSPGNHDPVRQALPQPSVPFEVAEPLYKLHNVKHVGNPAYVKLDGVNVLVYHGRSLDDIIAAIPNLSYSRPAAAMQVLLKSRHLAPMYGKRTPISPEIRDMMVIDPVPDVFHSGHVHAVDILDYRGTLIVNSGTFQAQTPFQANMGLEPTFSIVPILDLSTLTVVKRSFVKSEFSLGS